MASEAPSIPRRHKAAVYDKPGTISIKIVDVDTPEPGPGEVLVNLTHSGVCHSDYAVMTNGWRQLPYPTAEGQVGGHEGVGHVVKLGPGAESSSIQLGDRVGIKWVASACGRCEACLAQADGCCFNQKVSGYYTPGTFQQYVLAPANYVTPIPDGLNSSLAAPLLCAGVTSYAALLRSQAKPGQWVVVSGAGGGLGHLAVQIGARALGLRVIGVDVGESKEEVVKASGAEHYVDLAKLDGEGGDVVKHVKALTDGGLGAHAVVVCTASNGAYAQAVGMLRFNGVVVCVGMPEGDPVAIPGAVPSRMVVQQHAIVGSAVGNRREAIEVLGFAARGIVKAHVEVRKMEGLEGAFEEMHGGRLHGRVVLDLAS